MRFIQEPVIRHNILLNSYINLFTMKYIIGFAGGYCLTLGVCSDFMECAFSQCWKKIKWITETCLTLTHSIKATNMKMQSMNFFSIQIVAFDVRFSFVEPPIICYRLNQLNSIQLKTFSSNNEWQYHYLSINPFIFIQTLAIFLIRLMIIACKNDLNLSTWTATTMKRIRFEWIERDTTEICVTLEFSRRISSNDLT